MPRSQNASVENNFIGGLKTEFTGLNFPENSATETFDCVFGRTGKVSRRKGIDVEVDGVYELLDRTDSAVSSYVWNNATGDGTTNFLVVQHQAGGNGILSFYRVSDATDATPASTTLVGSQIVLNDFITVDGPTDIKQYECQYAQGQGYLFVFHTFLDPFYVSYDPDTETFTGTVINIRIRDFEGDPSDTSINARPSTLTDAHYYNLLNQGWGITNLLTSATPATIAVGSLVLSVSLPVSSAAFSVGDIVTVYSRSNFANLMTGTITDYTGVVMTITVTGTGGSGTHSDWNIITGLFVGTVIDKVGEWFDAVGNYPSNADVWWYFKDATDVFNPTDTLANVTQSSTRAPRGHFLVNPFYLDRTAASGLPNLTITTTEGARPSTGEFFQNRIFYAGVKTSTEHAKVYFSQVIESPLNFGKCYQENDPTSEEFFDLLPTDGGVVTIQNAGVITKLYATKSSVIVFTSRGIWAISGSDAEGLGFVANSFTVVKLADIRSISSTSFVEVQSSILWWNLEGIYSLSFGGTPQEVQIQSLTDKTIASFYGQIPNQSKKYARGVYNPYTFIVQWIYRSEETDDINEIYVFDRVLNGNFLTGAIYPWTISESLVKVNGINVIENTLGITGYTTKFLLSKIISTNWNVTFGEERDTDYLDWVSEGVGIDYDSYFITGYSVHGQAQKKVQSGYVFVFSEDPDEQGCAYTFQGLWDWAGSDTTGRWTSEQIVDMAANGFNTIQRRLLLRGQGLSLQLKFSSITERPFHIIGWSKWETANQGI